jgi:cyclase
MSPSHLRLLLLACFACLLLGAWRLMPAQDRAAIRIETQHVAGPVHMLTGAGGNLGVSAGPDGLVLIDDQFADMAERIRAALKTLAGKGPSTVRFLLNTHFHGDHTGGNAVFGREATVLAHANVRKRLAEGTRGAPMEPAGLPLVTFAEGVSLHVNGEEVRVVHYPAAHTDGDSVAHFTGCNVVHMGDLFFNGRFPFIDLDSGGSLAGLRAGVADVLARTGPATRFIPGHGPLAARADLEAYATMLAETEALVREAVAAGESVDAMLAGGLLEKFASWSWEFIDTRSYLQTLVRDLKPR